MGTHPIFESDFDCLTEMPKYYCDYCDTFLTHDSPSVRKTHNAGRKHKDNVRTFYQEWLEKQTQTLMDRNRPMAGMPIVGGQPMRGPAPRAMVNPHMMMNPHMMNMRPMQPMGHMPMGQPMGHMRPQMMMMGGPRMMMRPGFQPGFH